MDDLKLPKEWLQCALNDIAEINPSKIKKDQDITSGFVPMSHAPTSYIGNLGYEERLWGEISKSYTNFQNDDVILAKVTPCFENGKAAIVRNMPNGIGAGSSEFYVLRPRNRSISSRYIFALLKTREFMQEGAANMTGAVGLRRVPKAFVENFIVPLPSESEQKIIADKLDDLLARVESIKTRLENIPEILKKFRQSVLIAAVSGKLTEEWRQMKVETPLWSERKLSDIANIIDPHPSHRTPKSVEDGVPYIGIGDLKNDGSIDFLNSRKVSIEVLREHNERYVLKKGDFIFGKIGTLGKATSLPIGVDYTLSANVILIQPLIDIVLPQYLQYFLSSPDTMDEIARQSNSTSQSAFGIKKMRLFQCKLPSKEEQKEIIIFIEKYFSHIDSIECKATDALALIGNLTQSILAKAFRGELTAQWREENPELISGINSAEALLEKITAEKLAAGTVKTRAKKTSH